MYIQYDSILMHNAKGFLISFEAFHTVYNFYHQAPISRLRRPRNIRLFHHHTPWPPASTHETLTYSLLFTVIAGKRNAVKYQPNCKDRKSSYATPQ